MGTVMIAVIAGAVAAALWWRHSRDYVTTDDAYVDVQSQIVSPQVSGRVLHVLVSDNQEVKAGDPLLEIDPSDYQARLNQAKAAEAQAEAQVQQAQAQAIVIEAQFRQAAASVQVAQVNSTNAARDMARYEGLRLALAGAVSQQQLDAATTQASTASTEVLVAEKSAEAAKAQEGYVSSQINAAQAALKSARAQVDQAQLNLSYTTVRADLAGRIANKVVAEGNYIQPGASLMAIVPEAVYITANFKETQLAQIHRGETVEIKVDAYPDTVLRGRVDSIQAGSGQIFSVLPPQNATGNWVKIVQRVPVKILIDQLPADPGRRLGPGMSVEVKALTR